MAKTDAINPNRPAESGESPRLGDDVIRTLARAVAEILGVDHRIGSDAGSGYTEDAAGEHKQVKFYAPIATPTHAANKGFCYTKDVGGKAELHFLDESGNEIQLTSEGALNPALAVRLTGPQTIAGQKTFTAQATLADTSKMATSAAPLADSQIANKQYVDDQVDTQNMNPAAYTGGESVTFANNLIMKAGNSTVGSTVTFGSAFPNSVISIVACYRQATSAGVTPVGVVSGAKTGFTVDGESGYQVYWFAWGR